MSDDSDHLTARARRRVRDTIAGLRLKKAYPTSTVGEDGTTEIVRSERVGRMLRVKDRRRRFGHKTN